MKKFLIAASLYLAILGVALAGTFPPFAGDYGVRGGMNDWGLTAMTWDDATQTYSVEIDLDAGSYAFKVADNDWTNEVTFGNPGGAIPAFSPDAVVNVDIATDFGTDLNMDVLTAGNYLFELDLSGWTNAGALDAVLRVTQVVPIPAAGLLLLSGLVGLRLFRRKD